MKGYLVDENMFVIPGTWVEDVTPHDIPSKFVEFPAPLTDLDEYRYKVIGKTGAVLSRYVPHQEEINEVSALKEQLTSSDYRVTKCMEAQLIGNPLPYDIETLHSERQQIRNKINELETIINQ